jgi:RNA polymerase sigma-70 factor (ECF subfamily)
MLIPQTMDDQFQHKLSRRFTYMIAEGIQYDFFINIISGMISNMVSNKKLLGMKSVNSLTMPDQTTDLLELGDEVLVPWAIQGSMEAFSALYQKNITKIYNYIYYRTGNIHDAEDLTARVFHRAMTHITRYKNTGVPFSAWLYRIAHNLVANWHRDNTRRQEVPLEDQELFLWHTEYPEASLVDNQELDVLFKSVRKLTGERQTLLILKFVEEMSNAEVATVMGRSEGAIKSLYHRTLLALRREIESLEIHVDPEVITSGEGKKNKK